MRSLMRIEVTCNDEDSPAEKLEVRGTVSGTADEVNKEEGVRLPLLHPPHPVGHQGRLPRPCDTSTNGTEASSFVKNTCSKMVVLHHEFLDQYQHSLS